jgi:hypothetical protein
MQKYIMVLIVSLFLLLFALHARAADTLIVPGERIGDYYVNRATQADIQKSLGKPEKQKKTKDGARIVLMYPKAGYTFLIDPGTKIAKRIVTQSPAFATKEGIKVGSSYDDVIKAYGKPGRTKQSPDKGSILSYPSGINIHLNPSRSVISLSVEKTK